MASAGGSEGLEATTDAAEAAGPETAADIATAPVDLLAVGGLLTSAEDEPMVPAICAAATGAGGGLGAALMGNPEGLATWGICQWP
jgi:hypothetical protein